MCFTNVSGRDVAIINDKNGEMSYIPCKNEMPKVKRPPDNMFGEEIFCVLWPEFNADVDSVLITRTLANLLSGCTLRNVAQTPYGVAHVYSKGGRRYDARHHVNSKLRFYCVDSNTMCVTDTCTGEHVAAYADGNVANSARDGNSDFDTVHAQDANEDLQTVVEYEDGDGVDGADDDVENDLRCVLCAQLADHIIDDMNMGPPRTSQRVVCTTSLCVVR